MSQLRFKVSPWATAGLYLLSILLIAWPLMDFITTVVPFQLGNAEWRYGTVGILSSYLAMPMMGLFLAMALTFFFRHPAGLRGLSLLGFLAALVLAPAIVAFALDVLQLREARPPDSLPSFYAGAIMAEIKHVTTLITLVLLSFGGWATARSLSEAEAAASKDKRSPDLVMTPQGKPRGGS